MAAQHLLILMRSSPYGSHQPRAGLDVALTAAAFAVKVSVVFLDDGVLQLIDKQDTRASGMKEIGKMIPALTLYEVESVYALDESIQTFGIQTTALAADIQVIDNNVLRSLVGTANQVMVF